MPLLSPTIKGTSLTYCGSGARCDLVTLVGRAFDVHQVHCMQPPEVGNLLCAQENSASYLQWDGKSVAAYLVSATG